MLRRHEVASLERQIKNLREDKGEAPSQRATVLQHLLEDANHMKAKFEQVDVTFSRL